MRFLSLFSGIGGIDLGLERAGMTVAGQCEQDDFCLAVLEKHWPGLPRWKDVRDVSAESVTERCGAVDLVAGGFPCQDISAAGKGAGLAGERSGLWYEMLRIVRDVRPVWVLAENVPALRTRGADDVLGGLEAEGYTCWPVVVGAWAVGAPHKRDRVWIVAHAAGLRRERLCPTDTRGNRVPTSSWQAQRLPASLDGELAGGCSPHLMADPGGAGRKEHDPAAVAAGPGLDSRRAHAPRWPSRPGEPQHDWEAPRLVNAANLWNGRGKQQPEGGSAGGVVLADGQPQSRVGVAVDGLPRRLDGFARRNALKALGNAVVPQVVEAIGRCIMNAESNP